MSRSGDVPDAWAEVRALVGLAGVTSPRGSEADVLTIAKDALATAEASGQQFSAAIAHQLVSASSCRMLELDEAIEHADTAVRIMRELGARWELASVLGDRGTAHRVAGRLDAAELDLREAFVLCRDLNERALVTWTASELARTLAMQGDVGGARSVLADPVARTAEGDQGGSTALLYAEAVTDLAEGDRPGLGAVPSHCLPPKPGSASSPTAGRRPCGGRGPSSVRRPRAASGPSRKPGTRWSAMDGARRSMSPSWWPASGWLQPPSWHATLTPPHQPSVSADVCTVRRSR